ncbi:MAG: nucleotide disphospho-sugar-binding domain-containing protein [Chloroflexia bacterium]
MNKRILLQATARAGGDLNPMVALAIALRDEGYDLTVLCDPYSQPVFARMDLPILVSGPEYEVGDRVKAALKVSGGLPEMERASVVDAAIGEWRSAVTPSIEGVLAAVRPGLIITSFFGTCIGSQMARLSGKPWVALNSTYYIGPNPPRPVERDFSARAADIFRYSVIPYLPEAELVLHATDAWFDYDHRGIPPNHRYVGPLFWEAPGAIPAYLREPGEPWLLCTLSSHRQDDTSIAHTAMHALAHTKRRLAVTIGTGHTPDEVAPVPANARVEQYIPHSTVLESAPVFVSHAGHGSVMKSLWYGVPMVLVPWSRDQFGVAARAGTMRAAIVIPKETLTVHVMAEAIDAVLHEPEYRWAAQAASARLRHERSAEVAVQLVAEVLSAG